MCDGTPVSTTALRRMQSASRRSVKRWLRIQPDNSAYLSKRQGLGVDQAQRGSVSLSRYACFVG